MSRGATFFGTNKVYGQGRLRPPPDLLRMKLSRQTKALMMKYRTQSTFRFTPTARKK